MILPRAGFGGDFVQSNSAGGQHFLQVAQFRKQHQMSLDEAPYTGMYGFMQNNYCPTVGQFEGQNFTATAMERMIVEDISPKQAVNYLEELMLNVN